MDAKKSELQTLRDEETALETEQKNSSAELENMTLTLQETQLQISQVNQKIALKKEGSSSFRPLLSFPADQGNVYGVAREPKTNA